VNGRIRLKSKGLLFLGDTMKTYNIVAKVDQIVTKEVFLIVEANSEGLALDKARAALQEYPDPVTEPGIKRIVTEKSKYWIPRNIDFVEIKKEEKNG
jgi:hypothetical protein